MNDGKNLIFGTTVKCPHCGVERTAIMPSMGRKMALSCPSCNKIIFKKEDSCCVFCSYGIIKCPVEQEKERPGDGYK
jgi:hypothetical protein